jgi:hypothetical protein
MLPRNASTLPPFSNQHGGCPRCRARYEIRVHFDRTCPEVDGDHFHRECRCGHVLAEQTSEAPRAPSPR